MGPLRFGKGELYKTFPAEKVIFHKDDLFDQKGLVKVSFNSHFLMIKCPISNAYDVLNV